MPLTLNVMESETLILNVDLAPGAPAPEPLQIHWSVDTPVATLAVASDGLSAVVTGRQAGTATVTVTIGPPAGVTAPLSVNSLLVTVTADPLYVIAFNY